MPHMAQSGEERSLIGVVTEALPDTNFKVKLEDGSEIHTYLSGRMRLNRIKVLIGDKVELIPDQYKERGRIIKRL